MVRTWTVGKPHPARSGRGAAEAPAELGQAPGVSYGGGGGRAGLDRSRIRRLALVAIATPSGIAIPPPTCSLEYNVEHGWRLRLARKSDRMKSNHR